MSYRLVCDHDFLHSVPLRQRWAACELCFRCGDCNAEIHLGHSMQAVLHDGQWQWSIASEQTE